MSSGPGLGRGRSEVCRDGAGGKRHRQHSPGRRTPEPTGQASPEILSYGSGTPAEGSPKNPNVHYFLSLHLLIVRNP